MDFHHQLRKNLYHYIVMVMMIQLYEFDQDQMDVHVLYINIDQINLNQIFD